jgi:hypothetical protein
VRNSRAPGENGVHAIAWQEFPVPSDRSERLAMAGFCNSLSAEDWIALEALSKRVRNDLLKMTIQIALKWRARRTRRAVAK